MNILALDLATRTGWALRERGRTESGAESFEVKRGESPGMRYLKFNAWLDEVALIHGRDETKRVELIVYEQPFVMRSGAAAEISLGLATRVQEFCARHGIEHAAVNGSTLKKWTTGRGNADKVAMLEAVARRWRRVDDDNEADAVALLYYALEELVPATVIAPREEG